MIFCASLFMHVDSAYGEEVYYPFHMRWDEAGNNIFTETGYVHDAPAGKHGFINSKDDKLYFEDGTRVRLWGIGMTFSGRSGDMRSPPPKNITDILVNKLVSYGFNHVRLVGFDLTAPEISSQWLKKGIRHSETLDRLDYLISKLREAGIYYSISINNSAWNILKNQGPDSMNTHPRPGRKFKNIRLYHQESVERQARWFKEFFGRKNKYTGLSLAQDPANIYIAAVNEDSMFESYFSDYRHASNSNQTLLETKFTEYLADRYPDTDALKRSWSDKYRMGLHASESLDSRLRLIPYKDSNLYSDARVRDTVDFLIRLDINFAKTIKNILDSIGYKGLFTGTNNWYGYGSLYANRAVGDYIEVHGYFDHPRKAKGTSDVESIRNYSFVESLQKGIRGRAELKKDNSFPLYKMFASALTDRPLVISEWNHAGWSDYAYEGPIMLMAYSSFHGHTVLSAHTLFTHPDPDPKAEAPYNALAAGTNPVFMALSPSLSRAFVNGYIKEPDEYVEIFPENMGDAFSKLVVKNGLRRELATSGYPVELGFTHKLRTNLEVDNNGIPITKPLIQRNILVTVTNEIKWEYGIGGANRIIIDTEKFKAVAGDAASNPVVGEKFRVELNSPGAFTLVSLDNQPISSAKKLLATTVSNFRNTEMRILDSEKHRKIVNPGKPPVLLRNVSGSMSFVTEHSTLPRVSAVHIDGSKTGIDGIGATHIDGGYEIKVPLGGQNTPWVAIEFD